jgi:hypothetical protein
MNYVRHPTALRAALSTAALALVVSPHASFATAAQAENAVVQPGVAYATLADFVVAAPLIVDATVRSATRIKGAEAANVAPGTARFYVEADVVALVRGSDGVPPRVGYVVDVATDAAGKPPKLKKRRMLLFARPVLGSPGQIQLVGRGAQLDWSADSNARVRRIAAEIVAADAPPAITGIGSAFHVPGALPGEGETQIFLTTADNRPVSLSVLRRPGEEPRWAVALSEIVDEAAAPPTRDTLLWYRLACGLPSTLPAGATASLDPDAADKARQDYAFVIAALGPCGRAASVS